MGREEECFLQWQTQPSLHRLAIEFGVDRKTIRRWLRNECDKRNINYETMRDALQNGQITTQPLLLSPVINPFTQTLHALSTQNLKRFYEWHDQAWATYPRIRIAVAGDIHIGPDMNIDNISVFLENIRLFNPHIVVFNGDMFEFGQYGKYPKTARLKAEDGLMQSVADYKKLIDYVAEAAPTAIKVYQMGNHCHRLLKWLSEDGAAVQDYVLRQFFIDMCYRDTLFLGNDGKTVDAIEFGNKLLLLMHGNRSSKYVAAQYLADYPHYRYIVAGHTHRPQMITESNTRIRDGQTVVRESHILPTMGEYSAEYHQYKSQQPKWNTGYGLITIVPALEEAWVQSMIIKNGSVNYGGLIITS